MDEITEILEDEIEEEDDEPLGALRALYELKPEDEKQTFGRAAVLIPLGLASLLLAVISGLSFRAEAILIGAAIVLTFSGGYILYRWYTRRDLHILVYEDGIAVIHQDDMQTYRWDDMDSLFVNSEVARVAGFAARVTKIYTLVLKKGKGSVVEFTEVLPGVDELAQTIHKEILVRRLPEDLKRLEAGERLRFGKLYLDKQGISTSQKELPWDQVWGSSLFQGSLVIYDKSKKQWQHCLVADIPNIFLLIALIEQKTGIRLVNKS